MRERAMFLGVSLAALMHMGCAPTEDADRAAAPSQTEDPSVRPEDDAVCLERVDTTLESGWRWSSVSGLGSQASVCGGFHVSIPDVRHEGLELVVNAGPVGVGISPERCENSYLSDQVWGWRPAHVEIRSDDSRVSVEARWEQVDGGVEKGVMLGGECHFPKYESASPESLSSQLVLIDARWQRLLVVLRGFDASTGELLPMTVHVHRRS